MTPSGSHEIMCVFISWFSMVPHWQPWNKVIIFHGNISLFHDNNHAGITSPFVFVSMSVLLMHFWELIFFAEIFITTRFTTFFCLWVILITHYALVGIDLFRIFIFMRKCVIVFVYEFTCYVLFLEVPPHVVVVVRLLMRGNKNKITYSTVIKCLYFISMTSRNIISLAPSSLEK